MTSGVATAPLVLEEYRARPRGFLHGLARFCRAKPMGAFGMVIVLAMCAAAAAAPLIAPYDPLENDTVAQLAKPSSSHPFGADQYGRDLLTRVIYGGRTSLGISIAAGLLSAVIATVLGIVSAYYGKAIDFVLQRVVDTLMSVPALVFLMAVMVTFGVTVLNMILALAVSIAIGMIRVIRSTALTTLVRDYVGAAKSIGAPGWWIMLRHVLPNVLPTTFVLLTINFGSIIIAEATLSFLGLGIPPPTPTWGAMLSGEGRVYMYTAWWLLAFPTLVLSLAVFGINMFGDAIRDWFDPRARGRRGA
jgi:peptide/nickel transport system permease protein